MAKGKQPQNIKKEKQKKKRRSKTKRECERIEHASKKEQSIEHQNKPCTQDFELVLIMPIKIETDIDK